MRSAIAALVAAEAVVPRAEALAEARERRTLRRADRRAGRRPALGIPPQASALRVRRSATT
jgi:hypothetical protein